METRPTVAQIKGLEARLLECAKVLRQGQVAWQRQVGTLSDAWYNEAGRLASVVEETIKSLPKHPTPGQTAAKLSRAGRRGRLVSDATPTVRRNRPHYE